MKQKILIILLLGAIACILFQNFSPFPIYTNFFQSHVPEAFFRQALGEIWDDSQGHAPMVIGGGSSGISEYSGSKNRSCSFPGDDPLRDRLLEKYYEHVEQSLHQSWASIDGRGKGNSSPDGLGSFSLKYKTSRCGGIIVVTSHVYDNRVHIDILMYEHKK